MQSALFKLKSKGRTSTKGSSTLKVEPSVGSGCPGYTCLRSISHALGPNFNDPHARCELALVSS